MLFISWIWNKSFDIIGAKKERHKDIYDLSNFMSFTNAHCIWFDILFSMSSKYIYIYISLLGLTFSARLNTFQKTSQIFAGDWQYSGCIHNSSLMPNAIFYGLMFSLLFINFRTPMPSYSLFFFFIKSIVKFYVWSKAKTAAFTFYGNCRYEIHNAEFLAKTRFRTRLKDFE